MAILSAESKKGNRFVLYLSEGTELIQGILQFCSKHKVKSAQIQVMGLLKQVTWQPGALGQTTLIKAPLQLLSGSGFVFVEKEQTQAMVYVLLGGKTEAGTLQFGMGPIRQAMVLSTTVVLEVFEDIQMMGNLDPQTQMLKISQFLGEEGNEDFLSSVSSDVSSSVVSKDPLSPLSFEKGGGTPPISWKTVQTASSQEAPKNMKQNEPKPVEGIEVLPKAGDILDHETFGRCEMVSVDEDRDRLTVRARSGRLLELALDYLHLQEIGQEGEIRIFKMLRRKPSSPSSRY